jgi:pyruvyltransferase
MRGFRRDLLDLSGNLKALREVKDSGQPYQSIRYFNAVANWGDHINPYIIEKMTGKTVIQSTFGWTEHLLAVGSVLRNANRNSIVWGSGFISSTSKPRAKPKKIAAVRGPLTGQRLTDLGYTNPQVYGDPALLMPRFYNPQVAKEHKVGLVAHYAEKDDAVVEYLISLGLHPVDIQLPVEPFIDELCKCETIVSSSMHGLIAADAYGIPNRWLRLSDKLVGGEFKFQDYYGGIGVAGETPLKTSELFAIQSRDELIALTSKKDIDLDLDKLYDAFPS